MKKMLKRAACLLVTGIMIVQGPLVSAKADVVDGESSVGGITELLKKYYSNIKEEESADTTELFATAYVAPEGLAIANVTDSLNIRKGRHCFQVAWWPLHLFFCELCSF